MTIETTTETVAESTYKLMRADIIFGRLPPGRKLKLDNLRDRYATSVSTLREILNRLSSEGFVMAEGQRGFEVAGISAADLREVAELRLLLESHGLTRSFDNGDVDWEAKLVAAHHKLARMEQVIASGDTSQAEDWKKYYSEFHHGLIAACDSRLLLQAHSVVFDKYLRYQMVALSYRGDVAVNEHQMLLKAALQRNQVAARELLAKHIEVGVEHALTSKPLART